MPWIIRKDKSLYNTDSGTVLKPENGEAYDMALQCARQEAADNERMQNDPEYANQQAEQNAQLNAEASASNSQQEQSVREEQQRQKQKQKSKQISKNTELTRDDIEDLYQNGSISKEVRSKFIVLSALQGIAAQSAVMDKILLDPSTYMTASERNSWKGRRLAHQMNRIRKENARINMSIERSIMDLKKNIPSGDKNIDKNETESRSENNTNQTKKSEEEKHVEDTDKNETESRSENNTNQTKKSEEEKHVEDTVKNGKRASSFAAFTRFFPIAWATNSIHHVSDELKRTLMRRNTEAAKQKHVETLLKYAADVRACPPDDPKALSPKGVRLIDLIGDSVALYAGSLYDEHFGVSKPVQEQKQANIPEEEAEDFSGDIDPSEMDYESDDYGSVPEQLSEETQTQETQTQETQTQETQTQETQSEKQDTKQSAAKPESKQGFRQTEYISAAADTGVIVEKDFRQTEYISASADTGVIVEMTGSSVPKSDMKKFKTAETNTDAILNATAKDAKAVDGAASAEQKKESTKLQQLLCSLPKVDGDETSKDEKQSPAFV